VGIGMMDGGRDVPVEYRGEGLRPLLSNVKGSVTAITIFELRSASHTPRGMRIGGRRIGHERSAGDCDRAGEATIATAGDGDHAEEMMIIRTGDGDRAGEMTIVWAGDGDRAGR